MRGSRNFCQLFYSPRLILQFTEEIHMVLLLRKLYLYFTKDPEGGPLFSRSGGPTFSREGVPNANFYRNPYNLLFSRGGGGIFRTHYSPLESYIGNVVITGQYLSQSRF